MGPQSGSNRPESGPSKPKAKTKTHKEDDSDWEKVISHHQDRKKSSKGKTQPTESESPPSTINSLVGKRSWATDSESEGKVEPKRT